MSSTTAIVALGQGKAEIQTVPVPKLVPGRVLVEVKAVGLNPTDWKFIDGTKQSGVRAGCDYAGIVVDVAPDAEGGFQRGDRIAGWVHGGFSPEDGSFGGYVAARPHLQMKIPDGISFEEAATFGVSITTVGQGLYKTLGLPLPTEPTKTPGQTVLIYGGSTATGIYGIQYAKASGFRVLATSSPKNFELLKSLGADEVFDYKAPEVGAAINKATDNKLLLAWDCTGMGAAVCAAALSDAEGVTPKYATIIPVQREQVEKINPRVEGPTFTLAYDCMGVPYSRLGGTHEPPPDEADYARMFWKMSRECFERGLIRPLKPDVNVGGRGLEGVLKGLDELKLGKVSAGKLVYNL
ncbi:GroES-like protein [Xylariaceae sp. FL0016]|nr:GroES-like protein [Xylariaceae sp. FL0016]